MKTNKQTNNKTHRIWKPKEAKKAQQKPRKTLGDSQNWTLSMFGTLVLAAASQILFHSTLVHSERCCCFTRCWANTQRPDPGSEWVIWSGSAWKGRRMLGQRDQSPFSLEAKEWSFLYLLKALNKKKRLIFMAPLLKRKASERLYFSTGKHKECAYLAEIKW